MATIKKLVVALSLVGVVSCATVPGEKSETSGTLERTEPRDTVVTKYLPGRVVSSPYPIPDSSLIPDVQPLTEEHITGDDIGPDAAMATALAWSGQYHSLATTYDVLRGWIIGVRAGQQGLDVPPSDAIVSDPP